MLMGDGLRRNAWKFPVKIAAKDRFRAITYGELNQRVNQLANGLLSAGVRRGDAVARSVANRVEHLEILFATAKIGALAIPLDVKWKALEVASVIAALEPFTLLRADVTENDEDDKALLKYFSSFGPPTIAFFDSAGRPLEPFKLVGFVKAEEFAAHVQRVATL